MGYDAGPSVPWSPDGPDDLHPLICLARGTIRAAALGTVLLAVGCASFPSTPVGPDDIPALENQVARQPGNAEAHLRLGSALASAGRCDEAVAAATRGGQLAPANALGPLVAGRCLEGVGDYDEALALYGGFLDAHSDARGAAAVEGRRLIALQAQARVQARLALQREEALAPSGGEAVAVLPFLVDGDAEYQPLAAGLAHMLSTDLAVIGRFPLVERIRLDALLTELNLASGVVDPSTAARTGRLTGASRIIVGTLSLPEGRTLNLGGSIVLGSGESQTAATADGVLADLLDLEKDYALEVAENLGYVLSEAERQRVLQNRPRSLAGFLAFSRGLLAEGRGDFGEAAAQYQEAVRRDPGFADAATGLRRAVGAEIASDAGPGETANVVARVDGRLAGLQGADPLAGALVSSVLDLASHQPERATLDSGWANTAIDALPGEADFFPSLQALITIVILIPR